jgi:hypothetical protein
MLLSSTSSPAAYETLAFKRKVNDALKDVERILCIEKKPSIAGDVDHTYGDKYELVNSVSNISIIAYMNTLQQIGLDTDVLKSIDVSAPTTLRFDASTSCKMLEKKVVDVPMDRSYEETVETKSTGILGNSKTKRVSKVVQHVEEWHYKVKTSWSVSIYQGTNVAEKIVIKNRHGSTTLITQSKSMPLPEHEDYTPVELPLTWLLQQIDTDKLTSMFRVDVEESKTKTPRRNEATQKAIDFAKLLKAWANNVQSFMVKLDTSILAGMNNPALPTAPKVKPMLRNMASHQIFNPILPLFQEDMQDTASTNVESKSVLRLQESDGRAKHCVLPLPDMTKLLDEHVNSMAQALDKIQKCFPPDKEDNIVAFSEAAMYLLTAHLPQLVDNFVGSMAYVEEIMEQQLLAAIGKRLTSGDLDTFVKYHNARMLSPIPQPFSQAIRQPEHNPVGQISIESSDDEHKCIHTHTRLVDNSLLKMPLNAATTLEMTGKQYLHGWLNHRFEKNHHRYQLVSRARQFSAFILVIGTMTGPNTIDPKNAIIIQNKDEVIIPLLLNELPTAKEFKDAIKSLSPEQQSFAQAYRSMQLQSSVFGIAVIQIKPQLEVLLGLPQNSLDKEMKLTQDLMELFTEFQVPTDLLSYNGRNEGIALEDKVANVQENVKAVMDVIDGEKLKQIELAKAKTDMAIEQTVQDHLNHDEVNDDKIMMRRNLKKSRMEGSAMRAFGCRMPPQPVAMMACESTYAEPPQTAACMSFSDDVQSSNRGGMQQQDTQPQTAASDFRRNETTLASDSRTLSSNGVDFTLLPQLLDAAVEKADNTSALRSTIIKTGQEWVRNRQENILAAVKREELSDDKDLKQEKDKAFDLLDALSRSGSLSIKSSELHVIVAVTHCFEKDIIGTIIQDNINPIQKLESSTLLFASAIHGVEARDLIKDEKELSRLEGQNPMLLLQNNDESESQEA